MKKMNPIENKSGWLIGGGVAAAIGASLCCVGPLILTVLGMSGAAVFTKLDFLRIPMMGMVVLLFMTAGYSLFRKRSDCEIDSICADPIKYRRMVWAYWLGLILAFIGITSPYWIIWISE